MKHSIFQRFLASLSFLPMAAAASCGAHFCPRPQESAPTAWQARWSVERSSYDLPGASGGYSIVMLDLRYLRSDRWIADLHVPYIALDAGSGAEYGFGNPMALVEYRWHPSPTRTVAAGAQLEVPLGDDHHGLAQPHYMAVPYASASSRWGTFFLGGTAGLSFAFGGDHDGMEGMDHAGMIMAPSSPIHPHEDFEAIYRASVGTEAWNHRARPEAFLNGQRVLTQERELGTAKDYVSAGVSIPVELGRVEIAPEAEVPVTAEHRFEWTVGLGCGIRF